MFMFIDARTTNPHGLAALVVYVAPVGCNAVVTGSWWFIPGTIDLSL